LQGHIPWIAKFLKGDEQKTEEFLGLRPYAQKEKDKVVKFNTKVELTPTTYHYSETTSVLLITIKLPSSPPSSFGLKFSKSISISAVDASAVDSEVKDEPASVPPSLEKLLLILFSLRRAMMASTPFLNVFFASNRVLTLGKRSTVGFRAGRALPSVGGTGAYSSSQGCTRACWAVMRAAGFMRRQARIKSRAIVQNPG
jgi:hypothetical protein